MMFLLLVSVLAVCCSVVQADVPSCASQLQYWNSYKALSSCLRSSAVSNEKKLDAIHSLRLAVENYAFVDIAINPPDKNFAVPVNVRDGLDLVEKSSYKTDADLQQALADVFIPLHDAHTRYNKPKPYAASFFVQPFRFNSVVDGQVQKVIITYSSADMAVYESVYGQSVIPEASPNVDGWEIVSMNGVPAMEVFTNEIDVGTMKDAGSRFNLAVNGMGDTKGYWGWRPMGKYDIPKTDSVTYLLRPRGDARAEAELVKLSVSWMGIYQDAVPAVGDAVKRELQKHSSEQRKPDESTVRMAIHEKYPELTLPKDVLALQKKAEKSKAKTAVLKNVPVTDASGVSYADFTEDIGILKVSTFGPADMPLFRSRVIESMRNFSSTAKTANKKLIVDLRSNGGGDICLGYALHRYLFPSTTRHTHGHGPHSMARYDMKRSELFAELSAAGAKKLATSPQTQAICGVDPEVVGYFIPCAWYAAAAKDYDAAHGNNILNSNGEWMESQAVERTRGGITSEYSQLIHEGCESEYSQWAPPGAGFGGITPDNVILLSDGLCGSTCAVFSSSIMLTGLAKTVVVGGFLNQPQSFWSFPGGEVETIEFLVSSAQELGLAKSANLPALLPDGATFRFAIREIYPWSTSYEVCGGNKDNKNCQPLEFVFAGADHRIYYNKPATDSAAVFDQVSKLFIHNNCPNLGYFSAETSSCATCPPGSTVNVDKTGCVCGYGVWDAVTGECEWSQDVDAKESTSSVDAFAAIFATDVSTVELSIPQFSMIIVSSIMMGGVLAAVASSLLVSKTQKPC